MKSISSARVQFAGIKVMTCEPIPSDHVRGYQIRLVLDKREAEKFKLFAATRNEFQRTPQEIEVPVYASYAYSGRPEDAYSVQAGDKSILKGSDSEKLLRHLVKAMPVDERIKKFIIGCLEKTQSFKAEGAPVESLPSLKPGPPVMPLKTAFPSPPPKPPVVQPAPMVSLPLAPVQSANPGGGITQTFFLKDPQHPQAPPVKMSVSVSLGPVTVVTR